jgi:hypothetical protein
MANSGTPEKQALTGNTDKTSEFNVAQNDASARAGLEANKHPLEGQSKVAQRTNDATQNKDVIDVAKVTDANKVLAQNILESAARIAELQQRLTRNPENYYSQQADNLLKAMGPQSPEFQLKDATAQRAVEHLYKVLNGQFS